MGYNESKYFLSRCHGLNEHECVAPGCWCHLGRVKSCGLAAGSMSPSVDFEVSKHCTIPSALSASCLNVKKKVLCSRLQLLSLLLAALSPHRDGHLALELLA